LKELIREFIRYKQSTKNKYNSISRLAFIFVYGIYSILLFCGMILPIYNKYFVFLVLVAVLWLVITIPILSDFEVWLEKYKSDLHV
jgi:membrane protein YdbS with pleckstrin-like domain